MKGAKSSAISEATSPKVKTTKVAAPAEVVEAESTGGATTDTDYESTDSELISDYAGSDVSDAGGPATEDELMAWDGKQEETTN